MSPEIRVLYVRMEDSKTVAENIVPELGGLNELSLTDTTLSRFVTPAKAEEYTDIISSQVSKQLQEEYPLAVDIKPEAGRVAETYLPSQTVKDAVSPQKTEALRCRVEIAQARQELAKYVFQGERDTYKDHKVDYVEGQRLRELTLKAGYTEFALGALPRMGVTDLNLHPKWPQDPNHRLAANIMVDNRYGIPPGRYDAVSAVGWLVDNCEADYPSGRDPLRTRVLKEINEVKDIRHNLEAKGEGITSLSAWDIATNGKLIFLLNPGYGSKAKFGWYTIPQLRGWLNNNPRSTVLKENEKPPKPRVRNFRYKKICSHLLYHLNNRKGKEAKRLMSVALMDSPFEDLVEKYGSK